MGNSGWTADPQDITVPPGAGPDDPRVYIGPNDPIATDLGQDAAIVFYWADGKAFIISVDQSGGPDFGQLHVWGVDNSDMTLVQFIDISFDAGIGEPRMINLAQDVVKIDGSDLYLQESPIAGNGPDTYFYGRSMGRGLHNRVSSAGSTVQFQAELVVLTLPSETYYANRAYEVRHSGGMQSVSVPGSGVYMRLRETNLAGAVLIDFMRQPIQNASAQTSISDFGQFRVGATDVTDTLVLTLQASPTAPANIQHIGSAVRPRVLEVWDIGDAGDFPDIPFIT